MHDPAGTAAPIETDALVVGAGPVGLFQVFQLGLLEMRAQIVDSLPEAGGQCVELYGDKPIYDIPALPVCSGRELVQRLQQQIAPFDAGFHFGQVLTTLQREDDGRFLARTDRGTAFRAKVVVIAGGVGAFQPRTLKIDGLARFEGSQLLYRLPDAADAADAASTALPPAPQVVVAGGEAGAVAAALRLADSGRHAGVSLLHRRDVFHAEPEALARLAALRASGAVRVVAGQVTGFDEAGGRLTALQVALADGRVQPLPADLLLVQLGLSPRLGPIADWGLRLEHRQLVVDTESFETDVPGIFAVGDVNTYPGKKKLIVCGFHEATLAAYAAARHVFPQQRVLLQYTTTSPRLHQLLGVAPAPAPDSGPPPTA